MFSPISDLAALPIEGRLSFLCKDGASGVYDYLTGKFYDRFSVYAPGASITPSNDGRYLGVAGGDATFTVRDLQSHLTHRYLGHEGRLSYVAPPGPLYPFFLTGDIGGAVRAWAPPVDTSKVIMDGMSPIYNIAFTPSGNLVVADAEDGVVRLVSVENEKVSSLTGHVGSVIGFAISPNGTLLVSAGMDGGVRLWQLPGGKLLRERHVHHGRVNSVSFSDDGDRVVSTGEDGRTLEWSVRDDAEPTELLVRPRPGIVAIPLKDGSPTVVIAEADGTLWTARSNGTPRVVRSSSDGQLSFLRMSPHGDLIASGDASGNVTVYATTSWIPVKSARFEGAIRRIVFAPDESEIACISGDGNVHRIVLGVGKKPSWLDLRLRSRDVSFSPDGSTMAGALAAGGVWLYSLITDEWRVTTGTGIAAHSARFSPDGRKLVSVDSSGALVVDDVEALFLIHKQEALER